MVVNVALLANDLYDSNVLVEIIDALLVIWFTTSTSILAAQSLDSRSSLKVVHHSAWIFAL